MSLPIALNPGTVVGGHYIIASLLNSGGFGAVYRGIDTSEGNRPCAIKETYDVTPAARRQALMEASVLFTVRSPHLPEVYDALEANGRFYLVMQLIEGQDLLQLLRMRVPAGLVGEQEPNRQAHGPCSEQEVLTWLLPIMGVLQELHSRHPAVMHRDIKPGNIILTPHQTAVLVDFGLTRLYDPTRNTQTMTRAVTEGFSPLEQYVGKTTPQSDIYALAATMYLLLTNRTPPPAMRRSMHDELIAPRMLAPAISLETERILLKALAVHMQNRYQSMQEFAEALQDRGFSSHSDPTISVTPQQARQGQVPSLTLPAPSAPTYANGYAASVQGLANAPAHPQNARNSAPTQQASNYPYQQSNYPQPGYGYPSPASPASPASTPPHQQGMVPQVAPPYQKGMAPQVPAPSATRSMPNPSNQGCLWGVLQGVLSAVLILFMRQAIYINLAMVMGFAFYVLAGFMTTRRGGAMFRGARTGWWAGITSTITYWVVQGVGLLILLTQYIQAHPSYGGITNFRDQLNTAWNNVKPDFPYFQFLATQPAWVNVLILLVGGLLLACALGWIGGILGATRNKAKMAQKSYP